MIYSWDIIGHEKQLLALERGITSNQLSHAYLFHGPGGIGKFSIAFAFAKILLCPNRLCHHCRDCQLIHSGIHPDLMVFKDHGESIKIDDVRELIYKTNLTSQHGRRVVLIENLERMVPEAQNSFLKTLEEPAGETIFLMTSSHVKKIIPTILSRVRQQSFFLVEDGLLFRELVTRFDHHPGLEDVLQLASGKPGLAITLLSDHSRLTSYKNSYNQIEKMLVSTDLIDKFAYAEWLESHDDDLDLFFDVFAHIIRKRMYDAINTRIFTLHPTQDLKSLTMLFEKLLKTRYLIDRNANKRLALENFLLSPET